jgi:G3E family GTPase
VARERAPVRERRRTPFTVIGGFLGAGKTTLVNHLLREAASGAAGRIAVLVNDFGAVNVDAALIEARSGDAIALTNGCVCCQIGDDLTMALVRALEAPIPFDAIVVEASGVSDPWRVAQIARADPTLRLEGIFVVVDASAIVMQSADPLLSDTIERQLRAADLVLLNKVDLVDAPALAAARACVAAGAGRLAIIETRESKVPPTLLVGGSVDGDWPARGPRSLREAGAAHGIEFESWSCRPRSTLSAARLRALLKAMPEDVLRLKGLVATDELPWAEIQFSGRHGSLRAALAPPVAGAAAIVAIGLRGHLPAAALGAAIDVCYLADTASR